MALLADRLAKPGLQARRVHDVRGFVADLLGFPDMQLARAVTPLAADGVPLEDRLPVPVLGPFHVVEPVRVAEKARGFDESLEMDVVLLVAGGQVPLSLPGIPGDR